MKNPFRNIKRGAEIALKSWFNITAAEQKVILLIAGLFILGMIVKLFREKHPELKPSNHAIEQYQSAN